jgi:hypothetical protein
MLLAGTCGHHCSSNPPGQAKQAGQQGRPAAAAAVPHALQHSQAVRCVGKAMLDLAEHSSSTATSRGHPAEHDAWYPFPQAAALLERAPLF